MKEQSEIQIFLSYANIDQERVVPVYDFLIKNGFPNTWIDCKKLLPGQPWEFEIQRNLRKSDIVLFFLSHTSVNKRGYVQKELKTALKFIEEKLNDDTYLIPIKLDTDVTIPEDLVHIQYLDINTPSALHILKQTLTIQTEKLGYQVDLSNSSLNDILISKRIVKESWPGLPGYEVEFSIPVLHSTKHENIGEISKLIEAHFLKSLQGYRHHKIEQLPDVFSWAEPEFRRTNTFDAHYSTPYHENYFLSIQYAVHWYGAGAAHPNYFYKTFNFLLNPLIEITSIEFLFTNPNKYFDDLVKYIRLQLMSVSNIDDEGNSVGTETLLDKDWVDRGTSSWQHLNDFYFSKEGLVVCFAPYQVGAFALGGHFITVPYVFIYEHLKHDIKHALSIMYHV